MASFITNLGSNAGSDRLHTGVAIELPNTFETASIEISGTTKLAATNTLGDWKWNASALQAVITNLSPRTEVNASPQHTLSGDIYLCVFGDKMGAVNISGTAFNIMPRNYYADWRSGIFNGNQGTDLADNISSVQLESGVSRVYQFYNEIKLSVQSGRTLINFSKGGIMEGYAVGWQASAYNPELDTFDFSFDFLVPPAYYAQRKSD